MPREFEGRLERSEKKLRNKRIAEINFRSNVYNFPMYCNHPTFHPCQATCVSFHSPVDLMEKNSHVLNVFVARNWQTKVWFQVSEKTSSHKAVTFMRESS
jgi:hypothetical protein